MTEDDKYKSDVMETLIRLTAMVVAHPEQRAFIEAGLAEIGGTDVDLAQILDEMVATVESTSDAAGEEAGVPGAAILHDWATEKMDRR